MTTGFIEGKEQLFDIRQESRAFFPMKVGLCMLFCCLCAKRFVLLCFPPKACQKFWNSSPIGHDQVNTWGDSDLELCSVTEPSLENSPLSFFSPKKDALLRRKDRLARRKQFDAAHDNVPLTVIETHRHLSLICLSLLSN